MTSLPQKKLTSTRAPEDALLQVLQWQKVLVLGLLSIMAMVSSLEMCYMRE